MRAWGALYDEIALKLNLPDYFGRNLNALDECLTDLEWLGAKGFVMLIKEAEQVLCSEPAEQRESFFDILRHAAEEWSHPSGEGTAWSRPPTPFHVILQSNSSLAVADDDAIHI